MTGTRVWFVVLASLLALSACVARQRGAAQPVSKGFLADLDVTNGCPLVGLSRGQLRKAMGRPQRRESTAVGDVLRYHPGGHESDVLVTVVADTVQAWAVDGVPHDGAMQWAQLRGCLQPGMSPRQARAALHREWGAGSELISAPDGRRYVLYRAGREGQQVALWFVGDSLVTADYCDPMAGQECPR
jgi:hypothetical protein